MLQNGDYDLAIKKSVHKLIKNPEKEKQLNVLSQAYKLANQKDQETIDYLRLSGESGVWDDIFRAYSHLKLRQEIVKTAPQAILDKLGFEYVNYDNEIINAKKKAAAYFYAHAQTLLAKGDKINARTAYNELLRVKELYSSYKDLDSLSKSALALGTSQVLFQLKNTSGMIIPADFNAALTKISVAELNRMWINYDMNEVQGRTYDYVILVNIKGIDVSPEALKEVHYNESKEIEDGFKYQLDANGNVMKDSLGNDIKITKYKTITCEVIETQQKKTALVSGEIEFVQVVNEQLLFTAPLTAQSIFENFAATAVGNVNALSAETKKKLGNKLLPFPTSAGMIMMAGDILKGMVKDIIYKNSSVFL
jgi:hypothetical protein